jgi:hypothetical protein
VKSLSDLGDRILRGLRLKPKPPPPAELTQEERNREELLRDAVAEDDRRKREGNGPNTKHV